MLMCEKKVQCDLHITEESDLSGCTDIDSEAVDPFFKATNEQSDSNTSL